MKTMMENEIVKENESGQSVVRHSVDFFNSIFYYSLDFSNNYTNIASIYSMI